MKQLTIFTPSFNRAHLLPRLYESLIKQTNKNFKWLIVDDGSCDNTDELVNDWINKNEITIQYYFQENQGMHGAHNSAYKLIDTELNVCIDSDDYMPDDGVEKIINFWTEHSSEKFAGLIGLDALESAQIIGTKLPNKQSTTLSGFYDSGGKGDKKIVYRTDVVKKYPEYGIYPGEGLVPLGSKYLLIDQDYELLILNEVLCIVEYQIDGSSGTIFKQYKKSPRGFAEARMVQMKYGAKLKKRFLAAIHYVSSAIFSKEFRFVSKSPRPVLTCIAIPFGVVLNLFIRIKIHIGK